MDVKRIASAIASKYGTHNPFELPHEVDTRILHDVSPDPEHHP